MSEHLIRFNAFRTLCLNNASDLIKAAEELVGRNVNHIVYHLSVLGLEEIGKIFMYWIKINQKSNWDNHSLKIEIDDHVKKIFYAIWGPSIGSELIEKKQIDHHHIMASSLHNKRLETLYGDINDTLQSAMKITDEETLVVLSFVKSRFDLASIEGEVKTEVTDDLEMDWFEKYLEIPGKRNYVFGKESQEKLIELQNVHAWIRWLKTNHEQQTNELLELSKKELGKKTSGNFSTAKPKWQITFTIITPSHSIPPSVLSKINKKWNESIQLFPGNNKHSLIIKNTLYDSTHVSELWDQGWISCKLYVIALNTSAPMSLFYWNSKKDIDKYYDKIKDLETNKYLEIKLASTLAFNWAERKAHLTEQNLELAFIVYHYLLTVSDNDEATGIMEYGNGLSIYAKIDVHLRLESSAFNLFYLAFVRLIKHHHAIDSDNDLIDIAFYQIEGLLKVKSEFERVMKLGDELQTNHQSSGPITLTEVAAMKNYCDLFILTIAARYHQKNKNIRLVPSPENPQ